MNFRISDYISLGFCFVVIVTGYFFFTGIQRRLDFIELHKPAPVVPVKSAEEVSVPIKDHAEMIAETDSKAGVRVSFLADLIIRDEGKRSRPYLDTTGSPTIGVGRNLKGNGLSVAEISGIAGEIDYPMLLQSSDIQRGRVFIQTLDLAEKLFVKPLTEHDVKLLLSNDLLGTRHSCVNVFGNGIWEDISEVRRLAIIDVMFNLGETRFRKFVKFIAHVKNKDWAAASVELLLSEAARENIVRYHRAATVLRTNDESFFDL